VTNLINATPLAAGYTMATDKTGREWLVVVAKGTYDFPDDVDRLPQLLNEQVPLVMTDVFTAEPGTSALRYEIDFAPRKPRCDVLLNGSCYAPGGHAATRVQVGLRVGSLVKSFEVVGRRVWIPGVLHADASQPESFTVMPISYNNAFGGVDKPSDSPEAHRWYLANHVGVGYHPSSTGHALRGKPLPNTEEIERPVSRPTVGYRPMAFGPVGRSWHPRIKWAGTYDQTWLEERAPFLPDDFDERYFQSAAEDQQMDYLSGGEEVVLLNLTPQGRSAFRLPPGGVRVEVFYKNDDWTRLESVVDTLVLEPDLGRLMLTARARLPLRRSLHEIHCVVVGDMPWDWYREQGLRRAPRGKRRFSSLSHLATWNQTTRNPQ
jgi:hypothetical protein